MKRIDKNIYYKLIDLLEESPKTRRQLIDAYIETLNLSRAEALDKSTSGTANVKRSFAGMAINEMLRKGIVTKSEDGIYTAHEQKPVVIRNERCEQEILSMLTISPSTKTKIKNALIKIFGTDKTVTDRDDNKLSSAVSEILRRLTREGVIVSDGTSYSLPEKIESKIDDINGILKLKEKFLTTLYKKGGEFFEFYFMTLLEKYLTKHHKRVTSNTVTAGAMDGGIDGIIETTDPLGFRETIMVQTKNRSDVTNETDIRGFYGAVCARQGSRGIFATTSGFHYAATAFLDGIDNCVGVDGNMIFKMATETLYGIKKHGDALCVDEKIL